MRSVYFFGGAHPIQESVIKHPPEDYQVVSNVSADVYDEISEYSAMNSLAKSASRFVFNAFRHPRAVFIGHKCDLIHTASGVIPLNGIPFVVGAEYYSSFVGLQHEKALHPSFLRTTLKRLEAAECRKILPFSEASKKSIARNLLRYSKGVSEKIEVLYPAIEAQNRLKNPGRTVSVLHVGNSFFEKGALELIKAVESLREESRLDVSLTLITGVPPHHRRQFEAFISPYMSRPGFKIITNTLSRKRLFQDYYCKSDIFALPSHGDLFGYVFLEAMSCGLPLIGTNVFAIPEIIEDGKNGFLVENPISPFKEDYSRKSREEVAHYLNMIATREFPRLTQSLKEAIQILAEDESLRRTMGKRSEAEVREGKFSVARHKGQLKRIYDEALSE